MFRSRILTTFLFLSSFSVVALSENVVQEAGPFIWDDGCGQQLQISVTVRSNVDGYTGLYLWDYQINNLSVQSDNSDGAVNGVGSFSFAFPEALGDLANVSVPQNWNSYSSTSSDGTTSSLTTSSQQDSDPNPPAYGTFEQIYALQPGQTMHIIFTTLPREVMDVQGCSSGSTSSCAQAVKAMVLLLTQRRHTPLGQLAYGSGTISDGGLRLSLGTRPHTLQGTKFSPRLVRVQATSPAGSCSEVLTGEIVLPGAPTCDQSSDQNSGLSPGLMSPMATSSITISSPADGQNFQLTDDDITSTTLKFLANSSTTQAISWTATLQYQPSQGAFGPYTDNRSFTSTTGTTVQQTYTGIGGQLQTTAKGKTCPTPKATSTSTITGNQVPNGDIQSYLLSLYQSDSNAVTPNLLVQIAEDESNVMQFCSVGAGCKRFQGPIYNSNGPWPVEGKITDEGKLHIGLMQVDVSKDTAWNWQANASAGAAVLHEKFTFVKGAVKKIRSLRPGLPDLTPLQLENMALMQYGDHPGKKWENLYYVASCDGRPADYNQKVPSCNGTWQWMVTTRNAKGLQYVNNVRNEP